MKNLLLAILAIFSFTACASSQKTMVPFENGKVYFISDKECKIKEKINTENILTCIDENGKETLHKPMSKEHMDLQMHKETLDAINEVNFQRSRPYFTCGFGRVCY